MPVKKNDEFAVFREKEKESINKISGDQRHKVLVIDDDNSVLEALEEVLNKIYQPILCSSGREGIKAVNEKIYAVILDVKMDGMDGFETFIEIKNKFLYLPVIFHSAYQNVKDPYEIINEYRPFGYIFKGSGVRELLDTVNSAVRYYEQITKNRILVKKLKDINTTLEKKVEKRTKEFEVVLRKEMEMKERIIKKEMEIAKNIQTSISPIPPKHDELDFSVIMRPAEEVGGDYYDIMFDEDNNLWFAVGDVSGHGVTPGLIMMMAQSSFSSNIKHGNITPKETIIGVNKVLYENIRTRLKESHFMTMTFLKYMGNGKFMHAGAHLDIVVYRSKTKVCELIKTQGTFLGVIPDTSAATENLNFSLNKDDIMLLYTDGIIEARHKDNRKNFLGKDKLQEMMIRHANKTLDEIKENILKETLDWCGNNPNDDITMVLVKRK